MNKIPVGRLILSLYVRHIHTHMIATTQHFCAFTSFFAFPSSIPLIYINLIHTKVYIPTVGLYTQYDTAIQQTAPFLFLGYDIENDNSAWSIQLCCLSVISFLLNSSLISALVSDFLLILTLFLVLVFLRPKWFTAPSED